MNSVVFAVLAWGWLSAAPPATLESPGPLRVATYNVAALSGDADAVVRTLRDISADITCLQELDDRTTRSGGRNQPAWLAEQLGRHAVFAPAIPLEGGRYGLALLLPAEPASFTVHRLPRLGNEEPRVVLHARVRVKGHELEAWCTHLAADWRAEKPDDIRAAQSRALANLVRGVQGTHVVMGDFNTDRAALLPALGGLLEPAGNELPTHPAPAPKRPLDQVWLSAGGRLSATSTRVVNAPGSDHLPLVVDLAPRSTGPQPRASTTKYW